MARTYYEQLLTRTSFMNLLRELVPRELLLRELLTNGFVDALNSPVKKIPYESPSDPLRIALRNKELRNKKIINLANSLWAQFS